MNQARSDSTRSAARYWVSSPLSFREAEGPWREGQCVNIGARGVLFRTNVAVPVSSPIDVQIALVHGANIQCSGHVVRLEQGPAGEFLIATAIRHLRFRREAPGRGPDADS